MRFGPAPGGLRITAAEMSANLGHEAIPSAKRLILSLRDMGYDFASAVADLVDNSIEAGASLVAIDVEFDGDDSWVRIADNGRGMTAEQLREAMRYGSEREYEAEDLGKFGLGLKTASLSQCQKLSVATRWNRERSDIAAYCWDLEHIEKTNRWEILQLGRNGLDVPIREPLKDSIGTVVLWQRLDRILGYKYPYGEKARTRLSGMCRDLELHLGMVMHRIMTGETRRKKFKILLNGNQVAPWDPFCRNEAKTKKLTEIRLPLELDNIKGEILIEPFVLPHQDDFSSPEANRAASGPASWNQQQGFYIYRAGRMIQSGGWCKLRAPDEHTKLARIALSFSPNLDEAFKINVAKMRVQLPQQLRDDILRATAPAVKIAREVYDRKGPGGRARNAPKTESPTASGAGSGMAAKKGSQHSDETPAAPGGSTGGLMTLDQFADRMRLVSTRRERPVVDSVLLRLRSKLDK